jgi:hypothetical protein
MILKAIDLSLMAEHLMVHKAVLDKLASHYCSVEDPKVKQIIYEQYVIMKNHVKVMIALMDPDKNENMSVEDLHKWEPSRISCHNSTKGVSQESLIMDLKNTAAAMADKNFTSALQMKADHVKKIHVHMALQQVMILNRYIFYIEKHMEDRAPDTTLKVQRDTMQAFRKMYNL